MIRQGPDCQYDRNMEQNRIFLVTTCFRIRIHYNVSNKFSLLRQLSINFNLKKCLTLLFHSVFTSETGFIPALVLFTSLEPHPPCGSGSSMRIRIQEVSHNADPSGFGTKLMTPELVLSWTGFVWGSSGCVVLYYSTTLAGQRFNSRVHRYLADHGLYTSEPTPGVENLPTHPLPPPPPSKS